MHGVNNIKDSQSVVN